MLSNRDLGWIAGLLEGEGSFTARNHYGHPRITLGSTDLDVLVRLDSLIPGGTICERKARNSLAANPKRLWTWQLQKHKLAAGWMQTLYPLMGERRQEQIRVVIARWKEGKK